MTPKPAASAAPKPAAFVTVASKLPMALVLQLCEFSDVRLPDGRGGYVTEKNARKVGEIVHINGTAYPRGETPEDWPERPQMLAGYALTKGVDKEFWDKWCEQNKGFPALESGVLFAYDKPDAGAKMAREREKVDSGLGPLVVGKAGQPILDPRAPRPVKGMRIEGSPGPRSGDDLAA